MPQNKVPKAFEKSAKKPAKELAPGQTTLSPNRDVAAHAMIDVATDGTTSSTAPLSAMKKPTGTRTSSPFKISAEVLQQLEVAVAKMSPSQPKRRLRSAIHLMEIRELRPPMQSPSPLYPSTCTHPSHVTPARHRPMLIPACASADLVMKKGAMVVIKYVDGIFVDADGVSVRHGADGEIIHEPEAPLSAGATQVGYSTGSSTRGLSAYATSLGSSADATQSVNSGSSPGRVQMRF